MPADEYGIFSGIVSTSGCLIAAAGAIRLGWRGRSKWEPCEEDVAAGPAKVGSLVAAVFIGVMYVTYNDAERAEGLIPIVVGLAAGTLASLVIYGLMVGTLVFELEILDPHAGPNAPPGAGTLKKPIIGAFWLNSDARSAMDEARRKNSAPRFVQELLEGRAYNPDLVWDRFPRALTKQAFVLSYISLTVCGTLALAGIAIVVEFA